MKPSSDVTGLYRNFPAYLWVEDEETRTYLQAVWEGESPRIWTKKRPKDPECRLTFVQGIARAQHAMNRVPQAIRDLRTTIRRRIGH